MNPESLSPLPPIVNGPLFVIPFFLVAMALGARVFRWLRFPLSSFTIWEQGFLAAALGAGCLQLVPCALGAVGQMRPPVLRGACVVLVLLLARDIARVVKRAWLELSKLSIRSVSRAELAWAALLIVYLSIVLVRALVLRTYDDDDGYHLSGPKRWLEAGTLAYIPGLTYLNASLGFEMLYAIALSFTDVVGAKLLHYSAGLFCLAGVVLIARRLGSTLGGLTAISLAVVPSPFSYISLLFGAAYVDFASCWMALASALLWVAWLERKEPALLSFLAIFAGLAGSFKFTSLGLAAAWVPPLVVEQRRAGVPFSKIGTTLVRFGALAALPVLPWLTRNWLVTGNPVYPMLSSIIPTRDWPPEHAAQFSRFVHYYTWAYGSGASLGEGKRKLLVAATAGGLVVLGGAWIWLTKRFVYRSLLAFALAFCVMGTVVTGLVFRYWLPATLCALLVVFVPLTARWSSKPWRLLPASAFLLLAIVRTVALEPVETLAKNAKIAVGLSDIDREYPGDQWWALFRFINSRTPATAKILAADFYDSTGMSSFGGFWSDRPVIPTDSQAQAYVRLNTWAEFLESLKTAGITHVVIFEYEAGQQPVNRRFFTFQAQQNEYPFSRRLVDEYGRKLLQLGAMQFYEVALDKALERQRTGIASGGPTPAP